MQAFSERERIFDVLDKMITEYEQDLIVKENNIIDYDAADTRLIEASVPTNKAQV